MLRQRRAFTFIELAVVLAVTGMMLGVVLKLVDLSPGVDPTQCAAVTRDRVQYLQAQVERFARSNDRLPTPARRWVGSRSATYGREAPEASLTTIDPDGVASNGDEVLIGALPWQALDITSDFAGDCWGNKYTYMVRKALTTSASSGGFLDDTIDGNITRKISGTVSGDTKLAYVIVSHGPDQLGAVKLDYDDSAAGTPDRKWCSGSTNIAYTNCLATTAVLMDAELNNGESAGSAYFDDIVAAAGKPKRILSTYSWGDNFYGNLGNGDAVNFLTPRQVGPRAPLGTPIVFTSVIAGSNGSCAIANTNVLYCWGDNTYGRVGDGTTTQRTIPAAVTLPGGVSYFTSVSTGSYHTCAIANTSVLYCWGRNSSGQVGDGTTTQRTVPTAVMLPGGVSHFTNVSVGNSYACAVANTNALYCWGSNGSGRLGDSTTTTRLTPTVVTLPGGVTHFTSVSVSSSGSHTCAIANTTALYCWGSNYNGQVGDSTTTTRLTPTVVTLPGGVTHFTSVSNGTTHTCAIANTSAIYCWGDNTNGQVGDGSTTQRVVPTAVTLPGGVTSFTSVSSGGGHTCAIANTSNLYCWGYNYNGQVGDGSTTQRVVPTAVTLPGGVTNFTSVSSGGGHTCAIANTGNLYCWGYNYSGQAGYDYSAIPLSDLVLPNGANHFTSVKVGSGHSCGIANTGVPYCWGSNSAGQLGNNSTTSGAAPTAVTLPSGVTSFTSLSLGTWHSCGIANTGTLYCWGFNMPTGNLGDGTNTDRLLPTAVVLPGGVTSFSSVALGTYHTCGIANTGALYCWGYNAQGQLGNNSTTDSYVPTAVTMPGGVTSFTSVAAGANHTCGIANTNALYCWGVNSSGQLGDNSTTARLVPTAVTLPGGVTSFMSVVAGNNHTCGVANTGALYCWGVNGSGQLGDNSTTTRLVPTVVSLPGGVANFSIIGAGITFTCAIANTGSLYCWGSNTYGQLGNNSTTRSLIPTAVTMPSSGYRFTNIALGGNSSLAW